MIQLLIQEAMEHGDKLQVIPIKRLQSIEKEIEVFKENEELNGFQKWIVKDLYKFELPTLEFPINSLIMVAVPHPLYANVEFVKLGKKYNFKSPIVSDFDNVEKYLKAFTASMNYHIEPVWNLPLKRLAVKSGLAVYGKNNICYVKGMGSLFSFVAYFTDLLSDEDCWRDISHAKTCTNCKVCFNNCPTGAIREDRFLIDNERCLSCFNESGAEFPEWMPTSVHHCLYDCLKCQINCPINKDYVNQDIGPIKFSEEETDWILEGKPYETASLDFQQRTKILGLHQWPNSIPRNLKMLMELQDETYAQVK